MNKAKIFRDMLNAPGMIVAPGVYDALGARAVQSAGFRAVYMTGNGAMASLLGKPDLGLATMTEMISRAHQISACCDLPLVCDADTGYGGLGNIKRTVEEFEAAGVAAIHIEDQIIPKRCGALGGIQVVPLRDATDRIRAAVKARSDDNFCIIARTDSKDAVSFEEALQRIRAFEDAGADLVMVEGLENLEQIRTVVETVSCGVLYNIYESARDQCYPLADLEQIGVKLSINCLTSTLCAAKLLRDMYRSLKETSSTAAYFDHMMPMREYTQLLGIDEETGFKDW